MARAVYMPDMAFSPLTPDAWRDHPLNRFAGAMLGVLGWAGVQFVFAVLLILGLVSSGTGFLFRDGVPDLYEWVLWLAMIGGPFVIIPAMLAKSRLTPWLYAAYIAVTFVLLLGAEFFALDWFSAARYAEPEGWVGAAIFALAVTIDLIVIRYLFAGQRPLVIFHRQSPE